MAKSENAGYITAPTLEEFEGRYVRIRQHYVINAQGVTTKQICPNQSTGLVTPAGVKCDERGCYAGFTQLERIDGHIRTAGKAQFVPR